MDFLVGWPGGDWQTTAKLAAVLVGGYLFLIWIASILWAYRDIRGRTRDPVSQLIGVSIVTAVPLVGIPIYALVRPRDTLREAYDRQLEQEAILSDLHSVSTCPNCRRPVDDDWMICAYCSHSLKQPCSTCSKLLMNAWRRCPYCGEGREPVSAAPAASRLEVEEPPPLELQPERRRRATNPATVPGDAPGREALEAQSSVRARARVAQDE